ncbi:MAG: DUF5723 family protein [Cyclobacteriaceae bacterium]|nr:hypothetical protein [Cyclobacteriaceae bacterium]MCH8517526.1 DUF5723 family protein [Cyclobacteriaceae bacterium]
MKKIYLILLIASIAKLPLHAQVEHTLPFMEDVLQSTYVMPNNVPEHKVSIGLPILSSSYFNFGNSAASLGDISSRGDDGVRRIRLNDLTNYTRSDNQLHAWTHLDLFSLRFKAANSFISFNVTDRFQSRLNYTDNMADLLINGNASLLSNAPVDFSRNSHDLTWFREFALGFSRDDEKFRYGARVKLIQGLVNSSSVNERLNVRFDDADFSIAIENDSDFLYRNAGLQGDDESIEDFIDNFDLIEDGITNYGTNFSNLGFAVDFAITYKYNDLWHFTAGANDLGFISWQDGNINRLTGGGIFEGVDILTDLLAGGNIDFDEFSDKIEQDLEFVESTENYITRMPARFYIGSTYNLARRTKLHVLLNGFYFDRFMTSATVAAHQELSTFLGLTASYTAMPGSFNNIGLGATVKLGPFQIYAVSDHMLSVAQPVNAKYVNVRVGMNFVFGRILPSAGQSYR